MYHLLTDNPAKSMWVNLLQNTQERCLTKNHSTRIFNCHVDEDTGNEKSGREGSVRIWCQFAYFFRPSERTLRGCPAGRQKSVDLSCQYRPQMRSNSLSYPNFQLHLTCFFVHCFVVRASHVPPHKWICLLRPGSSRSDIDSSK